MSRWDMTPHRDFLRDTLASQADCVMYIKVINQNASFRIRSNASIASILSGAEREKIKKNHQACQDRRADFLPFVITTDI